MNNPTRVFRAAILLIIMIAAGLPACAQYDPSNYSSMQWRNIGPYRGGRALTAVGVAGQPGLYYFGSVGGGVWKTTDAGNTWEPIFDSQPIASIGAVAVAPSDPNILYVGSGEADMRSQISYGNGMYRSSDAGKTWTHIGLTDTRQIGRVLIHPTNPNLVYVAALGHQYGANDERGVFRTDDGGKTWKKILFKDANTGAIDLSFEPGNPNVIYASLWNTRRPPWNVYPPSYGPGSGLYKSTDGGNTWNQLTGIPTEGLGRIGIAIPPAQPNRVYLVVDAKQGGIYRSDDAGKTFTKVANESRLWGRGWYFCGITADPKDADTVYVANTSLYKSTDGGKNWTAIKGAPGGDDYHALWIAPDDPNRFILAVDQGVIVSLNGGKTWSSWYNEPIGQFYRVATDNRFPYWVYGAQQDSGAYAVPSRTNSSSGINDHEWRPVPVGGESGSLAADPVNLGTIFGGTVTKYDWTTGQNQNVSPTLSRLGPWRNTWTLPLAFSPKDPRKLYASHQQLFRSTDGGNSWDAISGDLTRENPGVPPNLDEATAKDVSTAGARRGVIYAISPSPVDANLVWVGTDDGLIHVTHDDGKNWTNVTPAALTPWSKVGMIDASHFDAATAYAAVDRHRLEDYKPHILRTHDGGKTWQPIESGIPDGDYVNVVREDTVRKGLLYAGTELGIYVSFDDGNHWLPLQMNLPHVSVRDITIHENDLVIATHGRAFWILDDISALRQLTPEVLQSAAHLFAPATALRVRNPAEQFEGTPLPPETPKGPNAPSGAILDYWLSRDASSPVTIEIVDGAGKTVRRFASNDAVTQVDPKSLDIPMYWIKPAQSLDAKKGMHRWTWDMRYQAVPTEGGRGGGGGRGGNNGVFAVPGQYTVKLTVDGQTYTQPLTLKPDPRVKIPQGEYQKQFETAQKLSDLTQRATRASRQGDGLRRAAQDAMQKSANQQVKDLLAAFVKRVDATAGAAAGNPFAGEPDSGEAERPTLRNLARAFQQLYGAVESADAAPTADALRGMTQFSQQFEEANAAWNAVVNSELPQLNEKLKAAGAEPLVMPAQGGGRQPRE